MARRSSSKIPAHSTDKPQSGQRTKSDPLDSKFELIAELGRGGMATVYLARAKKRPDKLLVLKQLRSELAENPEFLAMFLEEARLAGKLQHPNIVETYEVGKDGATYYIAMEYLEGLSLQAVLTKFGWKGAFSFPLQVFVLIEALKALEHAYVQRDDDGTALKIVHRDVSPPNIIITFDGQVKLVDFGIAKAANSHVETRTGLIKGKLTYMAPEQAQSGDVDSRTDIYSVGVMLWQAAAGTRRWKGVENTEVLKRLHAGDVVESPNAKRNMLPAIVDDIVLKAIQPDPEKRHRSASAFRATLESLLREMNATVSSKDLSAFMIRHFEDARKRATEVMTLRIRELDRESNDGGAAGKESVTAIRTSTSRQGMSSAASEEPRSVAASTEAPEVGGAAAGLAKKVARPSTPARGSPSGRERTLASAAPRRNNRVILIAVLGVAGATALAFAALHVKAMEASAHQLQIAPSHVATSDSTPPVAPASGAARPPDPATSSAPADLAGDKPNAPSQSATHPHHGHGSNVTAVPAAPVMPSVPPSPATAVAPTPAPAPVASAASSADGDHPSLDKQDPWKHATHVEATDPWSAPSAHAN